MNREILFRGKRCSDGEWVYGYYVESKHSWQGHKPHKSWIVPNAISNGGFFNILGRYAVKDDTVGQYTGITDKNGVKIFEGDIVHWKSPYGHSFTNAVGHDDAYGRFTPIDIFTGYDCEVLGNIYDNPELLAAK